ncbi:flagellar filament capping protein FliD [Metabacillus endolithicus]|uniref:Flagellar hook-associated protein 2 n=1 Tax=Metabacillus endolithicus TaxID=1535204 RepID=A0ABW5C0U2_9BACI|nr:flagellar filament capping protein FliD [Metabacillus endolithicus]UPG65881.1 flagellar filament capping protein FliD [Metabacillus endolithicus]
MRIGGLASGMDTDTIVSDLMKAERLPLDKLTKKKQQIEWQRDAYRDMNTLLLNFRNQTFDMKLSSNFRARTVTSSNESKVLAVAKSAADLSSFSISKIDQLATAATKVNAGAISKDPSTKIDPTKSLYSVKDSFLNSNFGWDTGSVESQTLVAGATNKLTLANGIKLQNITTNTSVKVDGKSYEVVTGDGVVPATGQVHVDEAGNLQFFDTIRSGATIKVDYVADKRVETFKPSSEFQQIQVARGPVSLDDSITVTINGNEYKNTDSNNKGNLIGADGSVFATITEDGKIDFVENKLAKDTEVTVSYEQRYFAFDLGAHTSKGEVNERFLIQGSESLNSVLSKISSSNAGVSAFYDSQTDRVTLTRKETGDFNETGDEIITSPGFLNNILRFGSGIESGGENAKFTINGLSTERSSNTFEMNGVTFTLKDKLSDTEPRISINVANDTSKVVENITKFVNSYNELIGKMQSSVNETKYKDYQPLTDAEREDLTDKQQEKWEEMAKSGLLRRDSLLTGLLSKMRTDFYTPVTNSSVDSKFKQLANIGITTTANYMEGGKLTIDEDTLRKAIEENPDSVEKLFTSSGTTSGEQGILTRLYDSLTNTMNNIKTKAGNSNSTNNTFTLGKNLNNIENSITRFEDRLKQVESRYWSQFTAMEKAIQNSNNQMSYLMQQFSTQ